MRDDAVLYTLPCHHRVLLRYDVLDVTGGNHAFIRLAQRTQHTDGIGIFFPQEGQQTVCPLYVPVIGKHKVFHFPVYKEQGKEHDRKQQGVAYGNLNLRDAVHVSLYTCFVLYRNRSQSIRPALVSPNGKAIQTPTSPQPSTKPQRYPTGKDITK